MGRGAGGAGWGPGQGADGGGMCVMQKCSKERERNQSIREMREDF